MNTTTTQEAPTKMARFLATNAFAGSPLGDLLTTMANELEAKAKEVERLKGIRPISPNELRVFGGLVQIADVKCAYHSIKCLAGLHKHRECECGANKLNAFLNSRPHARTL